MSIPLVDLQWQHARIADEEMAPSVVFFEHNVSVFVDAAWDLGSGWWVHLQPQVFNGFIHQPPRLSDTLVYILSGVTGDLGEGWGLEFALIENVFSFENSVDFGLHMAISRSF